MNTSNIKPTTIYISKGKDGVIDLVCGDTDFLKTITKREKEYIHQGCNWISKLSRETTLKALHSAGYTLDEVESKPKEEQAAIYNTAYKVWNEQSN